MKCVVLAAGSGTRMMPLTATRSKPMIPVANRPFLEWLVERLPAKKPVLVVSKDQKDIIENFPECEFAYQSKALGTGDALRAAESHVDGRFLAVYGDGLFRKPDFATVAKNGLAIAARQVEDVSLFGNVKANSGNLVSIEEKSRTGPGLANCGLYALDERIFGYLKKIRKSPRGEYELTDAVNMLARDESVAVRQVDEWHTLSCPWDILDINRMLLDENGSMISGAAEIRSGAVIEEPVAIGSGATVGPNCFLRKYSSIGARCKVGQSVEIKNSVIMDDTYVSHLSYVGDSVVGSRCNIAAGTTFANLRLDEKNVKIEINGKRVDSGHRKLGGIVGDNVKFGVSCIIMPGKRIWPGLMIPPKTLVDSDIKSQLPLGYKSAPIARGNRR